MKNDIIDFRRKFHVPARKAYGKSGIISGFAENIH